NRCFKQLFVSGTKDRLLAAASELFAERGFHRTTVRDIAARARVNVAAGHYHYGSKRALYLAVLRAQFADVRATLQARGAAVPEGELRGLSRRQLAALLRTRVNVMLDLLIGPPPGLHGTLMHREMCDPSEALPVIVDEFILPMFGEMRAIAARLAPGVERKALERCVYSVVGQALFYRFTMPVTLRLLGVPAYPRGLARELAAHITEFSLGGVERRAARLRRVEGDGGWSAVRRAEEVARLAAAPSGEAAPGGPLTLAAALALAARGNRRIAEAEEQVEVARAGVGDARAAPPGDHGLG